ncbi:hypothetical protein [Aneurinibacillus thermoaerophilus]|uniref:hypothetical protein n=1 Tax=Aneurinibacillus thermoaerophilus TaxID=143495 RepID=UPI002E1F4BE0|nr:hypothetical protein [Aneurinibacillus thermoaerophilus]
MSKYEFLYLSQSDVVACGALVMDDVIKDLEYVFTLHHANDYILPSKVVLRWGDAESEGTRGRINAMPGYVGGGVDIAGIKWIGSAPKNPHEYRLPRASALIVLNDPETMLPLAVMDGTVISAMRTGGVTGTAAKYLARRDSKVAGMIGAGTQNRTQLMALKAALPQLSKVKVYDLSLERAESFAAEVSETLNVEVIPVSSGERAVVGADVVVTATTAKEPVIKAEWISEGCFYSHVGGYEAEFSVIEKANKIVVDDWEEIKHRGVQTLALMHAEKQFHTENIYAELGEIVVGHKKGRENAQEFIYFNSVGMAIDDLVVAKRIYENAKQKGVGTPLTLWDKPVFV